MECGVRLAPNCKVERIEGIKGELCRVAILESHFFEDRHIGPLEVLGSQVIPPCGAISEGRRI